MSRVIASNTGQLSLVLSEPGAYLPPRHLARFVDQAIDSIDLSGILRNYNFEERRGQPMFDPVMKTKLVIYGYCTGIVSGRGLANAVKERFDFRFLSGGQQPDSDTMGKFKSLNLAALANLFQSVLEMAADAGLIDLKVVALDGTKMLADASKHKAMSIDRLRLSFRTLKKEIAKIRRQLKRMSPCSPRRNALLEDMEFKTARFNTVKQAKRDLENRMKEEALKKAKEAAEKKAREKAEKQAERKAKKKIKKHARKAKQNAKAKTKQKESKPQINFTDKESRIMKMGNGWGQCYNAQAAVDRKAQIIVAQSVTQDTNDAQQWVPNLKAVGDNLGLMPDNSLGDTGYYSETNVTAPALASTNVFIPPKRQRKPVENQPPATIGRIPKSLSVTDKMRRKLQTKEGQEFYAMRKGTVEPVFGQIKAANLHFRQFSFRGLTKVQQEWALVCLAHNLLKIFRSGWQPPQHQQLVA